MSFLRFAIICLALVLGTKMGPPPKSDEKRWREYLDKQNKRKKKDREEKKRKTQEQHRASLCRASGRRLHALQKRAEAAETAAEQWRAKYKTLAKICRARPAG